MKSRLTRPMRKPGRPPKRLMYLNFFHDRKEQTLEAQQVEGVHLADEQGADLFEQVVADAVLHLAGQEGGEGADGGGEQFLHHQFHHQSVQDFWFGGARRIATISRVVHSRPWASVSGSRRSAVMACNGRFVCAASPGR